jgi:hypothetical protein
MNCPGSEKIAAHAEGRLEPAEEALLLEHGAECGDCREELALLTLARHSAPGAVPAEVRTRARKAVLRAIDAGRPAPVFVRATGPRYAYAAAAGLFIALLGLVALFKVRARATDEPTDVVRRPERRERLPQPPRLDAPAPAPETEPKPANPTEKKEQTAETPPTPPRREDKSPDLAVAPEDPPRPEETRTSEPPAPPRPSHTTATRALAPLQVMDPSGALALKRKGSKDKEKLSGVARLGDGDVITAEKPSGLRVEGGHPLVLAEGASVSLAWVPQEQAPYLLIHSGEALVDSTGPTRWIVSDGRVSLTINRAMARFSVSPREQQLSVLSLSEPLYAQPDGGQVYQVPPGKELVVGKAAADLRSADPQAVAKKGALFDAARPRQRTLFYTSCDPADAKRGHVFFQEGGYFRNEALLSHEKGKTAAAQLSANPRFAWRDNLVVRFRFMTNATALLAELRAEDRKYTLTKAFAVERKSVNQWQAAEFPLAVRGLGFRRDDGLLSLTLDTQDKLDWLRFTADQKDVFGDQKAYFVIDDVQVVERE